MLLNDIDNTDSPALQFLQPDIEYNKLPTDIKIMPCPNFLLPIYKGVMPG